MPRIPYVPKDLSEPRDVVAAVRARRGGELLNLDRMLLHSPPVAMGWNALLGAVRKDLALSPKLRELAMCVVAVLNGAEYEWGHHAPLFVHANDGLIRRIFAEKVAKQPAAGLDFGSRRQFTQSFGQLFQRKE